MNFKCFENLNFKNLDLIKQSLRAKALKQSLQGHKKFQIEN